MRKTFSQLQAKRRAKGKAYNPQGETQAKQLRDSHAWERMSKQYRKRFPLCLDPYGHHERDGVIVAAVEVHHIVPVTEAPERGLDESNLAQLCRDCHERAERGGVGERATIAAMVRAQLDGEDWNYG